MIKEISALMPEDGFVLCPTMAAYYHFVVHLMEFLTFPNVAYEECDTSFPHIKGRFNVNLREIFGSLKRNFKKLGKKCFGTPPDS